MKTIILAITALTAASTATLAEGNRNNDLRDTSYYTTSGFEPTARNSVVQVSGLVADADVSNFAKLTQRSIDRDNTDR
jgi:hypothetical protein